VDLLPRRVLQILAAVGTSTDMSTSPRDPSAATLGQPLPTPADEHDFVPRLVVQKVATGDLIDWPKVPEWVQHQVDQQLGGGPMSVLVLDLGASRFESGVLLDMLTAIGRAVHAGRFGSAILVVASSQPSVTHVVDMISQTEDLPMFVTESLDSLHLARPAGKMTTTERDSLRQVDHLGGRVTASRFATATDLELTAAGNRLTNLARRGYVLRIPRSRRQGDEFLTLRAAIGSSD
jgi:hypothetical protein